MRSLHVHAVGIVPWLNPLLPRELGRLKLEILYRGHLIDIDITENELQVTSSPGRALPIKLGFRDSTSIMNPGENSKFAL
ncbi:MAG TPA: glycosyl hydrolase family 65 protein [Nitrososphaerales archaeon]|nr:glycosyl hydrolase family 65 protein [Nitrososphaerales archaeon]